MLDLTQLTSPAQMRREVTAFTKTDALLGELYPIFATTIAESVVAKREQLRSLYAPWRIEENLSAAGRILDNTVERWRQAQELEAEAFAQIIQLQLDEQSSNSLELADEARLCSPSQAASDAVKELSRLASRGRNARISMLKQPGGALNFAERIAFLRHLVAGNLNAFYERAHALRLGLNVAMGLTVPPIPGWTASSEINELVEWLRQLSRHLDIGERSETSRECYFLLSELVGAPIANTLGNGMHIVPIDFRIEPQNIPFMPSIGTARLLGFGAALVYTAPIARFKELARAGSADDRSLHSFMHQNALQLRQSAETIARVTLPRQQSNLADLDPVSREWRVEPFTVNVGIWDVGSPSEAVALRPNSQLVNCRPFGDWKIEIPAELLTISGRVKRQSGGLGAPVDAADPSLRDYYSYPRDMLIGIRVAIR